MSMGGREEGISHPQPRCLTLVSTAPFAHRYTHREEGKGSTQHCLWGTPGDRTLPTAPRVQDQPSDPAVLKRDRSRRSSVCSSALHQLFAAGGGRQMPSSRPPRRTAGASRECLSSYPHVHCPPLASCG